MKNILSAAVAATFLLTAGAFGTRATFAGTDTRTISMYHVHTKESITITYKVNGRYVPSAMKKINYFMRDWRRKEVILIDPETVDLMWSLHTDLGSKAPISIVCGYRSPKTNAFLKRSGRNVARKSQHMLGKAIDLYFPDVSSEKIRNSALVRQVGGVGYYRNSAGPTGFVHIDSGNVRHWPRIAPVTLARIFRDYRGTVGRRLNRNSEVMVAEAEIKKPRVPVQVTPDSGDDEEDAARGLSAMVAQIDSTPPAPKARQIPAARPVIDNSGGVEIVPPLDAVVASAPDAVPVPIARLASLEAVPAPDAAAVPVPRSRPIEVLIASTDDMVISPAAAPPERQVAVRPQVQDTPVGPAITASNMAIEGDEDQISDPDGKGDLVDAASHINVAMANPEEGLRTSDAGNDLYWWPAGTEAQASAGAKPAKTIQLEQQELASLAGSIDLSGGFSSSRSSMAKSTAAADDSGKGDMELIDRSGKGDLGMDASEDISTQN